MQPTPKALRWGVDAAFLAYVTTMADGDIDVTGGATRRGDVVEFPVFDDADPAVLAATKGALRCTGHHGMLVVEFAEPRIELRDARLVLTIVDADEPDGRLPFADLAGATVDGATLVVAEPRLTQLGADLFMGSYRRGRILAPVTVELDPALVVRVRAAIGRMVLA